MNIPEEIENNYVDFISDTHLLKCISNLYNSYLSAKREFTKEEFYNNKVDIFKLTFDSKFNELFEDELIKLEMSRQIDKSVNNAIGTFHKQILSGVNGIELGHYGFDIKAIDNSLFAIFLFEEKFSNFEDVIFDKLARQANIYKNSMCYLVDFNKTGITAEKWIVKPSQESSISHKQVFRISADQFYTLIGKQENALSLLKSVSQNVILNLKNKTNC